MKFKFDSDLDYQIEAINSIIKLFEGQKNISQDFTIIPENASVPNEMELDESQILENLQQVQKINNIPLSEKLDGNDYSVEMETGTGKTYVYLRTIMELNKYYGFKKFIIIVPSVAIREGVLKTLEITQNHFKNIYNIPYNYYEYNSTNLTKTISQFSRNNNVEIMVMTLDSFNKDTNIMNLNQEKLFGKKPIDVVSQTKPILILDEPQNMEREKAKEAISKLNPLFKLRYSATHRKRYNLVYCLSPVEAFKKGLVKKIEVLSIVKEGDFNDLYLRCLDIKSDAKGMKAQLEVNKKQKSGFKVSKITVRKNDDLKKKTKAQEYEGIKVSKIDGNYNFIEFSNGIKLQLGEDLGGDREELMKMQIKETIKEHFRKSEILKSYGIKTLSLFFIDRVANYLEEDGFIKKTFEEEFENLKKQYDEFKNIEASSVHGGYFSKYKSESGMKKDKKAFDLIMKNKEDLLSFKEPIQFIFSHSALKEGWDNPNVFNICTLNQTVSDIKKRQEIGRGVRLPVNQDGDRIPDVDFNVLTVIANESYAKYVSGLQTEYEKEFGIGNSPPQPSNARKRISINLKKGFDLKPEFKELWKRISRKTRYSVDIDTTHLIESCIEEINKMNSQSIKIRIDKVTLSLDSKEGVKTHFVGYEAKTLNKDFSIPNLVERISSETNLTKNTALKILSGINNLDLVFKNPQEFISSVNLIIKEKLKDFLVNGIQYLEVNDWWRMEIFDHIDTYEDYYYKVNKSIYDGIQWDSHGERTFARKLDRMENVKLFIKLPSWFTILTPIGTYNPDWAVVVEKQDKNGETENKLYLVRETKFFRDLKMIRTEEKIKIKCAEEHFKTINVDFKAINDIKDLI